jgi:hypothetical protein
MKTLVTLKCFCSKVYDGHLKYKHFFVVNYSTVRRLARTYSYFSEGGFMAQSVAIIRRGESRARRSARKLGIIIDRPQPNLPVSEQEQTDTM